MREDSPVKSLADLKGRTVGYSAASFQDAYLNAILGTVGLMASDVKTINLNYTATKVLAGIFLFLPKNSSRIGP